MGVIWYHLAITCGLILFGFSFVHYYRKYNVITIPEYSYYLYDKNLESCFGFTLKWSALVCGIAMTIYLLAAGMWSVAYARVAFMITIGSGIPLAFW